MKRQDHADNFDELKSLVSDSAQGNAWDTLGRKVDGRPADETLRFYEIVHGTAQLMIDSLTTERGCREYGIEPISEATARRLYAHFRKEWDAIKNWKPAS